MAAPRSSRPSFVLRPATDDDRDTLYKIHRAAMYEVVKQTWGWDENFQVALWNRDWDASGLRIVMVDGKW
jgi:hypothetical protein